MCHAELATVNYNYKDDFRLDGQPRRRLLSVPKRTTHGLTTAVGSAFVGDATLANRGFRILGRHPLSIHHLALLRSGTTAAWAESSTTPKLADPSVAAEGNA